MVGPLYVVVAVFNPMRYRSRIALYRQFAKRIRDAGAELYTVELALGDRPHQLADTTPNHIALRTDHELWFKENLWNVGISRLPAGAQYVATIDADLNFLRPDWVQETIHQLQHHRAVQLFTSVQYLQPDHTATVSAPGFAFLHQHTTSFFKQPNQVAAMNRFMRAGDYSQAIAAAAPGGAWAYWLEDLSKTGGLIDQAILGSADAYMAKAIVGITDPSLSRFHHDYRQVVVDWTAAAERWMRRDIGFVSGTATHYWHGKMSSRGYGHRDEILIKHQFSPRADLRRDHQGLWQLHDDGSVRFCRLRDDIRSYFRMRDEDSIDP